MIRTKNTADRIVEMFNADIKRIVPVLRKDLGLKTIINDLPTALKGKTFSEYSKSAKDFFRTVYFLREHVPYSVYREQAAQFELSTSFLDSELEKYEQTRLGCIYNQQSSIVCRHIEDVNKRDDIFLNRERGRWTTYHSILLPLLDRNEVPTSIIDCKNASVNYGEI